MTRRKEPDSWKKKYSDKKILFTDSRVHVEKLVFNTTKLLKNPSHFQFTRAFRQQLSKMSFLLDPAAGTMVYGKIRDVNHSGRPKSNRMLDVQTELLP